MASRTNSVGALRDRIAATIAPARAADGLITFSVMWALALIFSTVSHTSILLLRGGIRLAVVEYSIIALAIAVLLNPRRLSLLLMLAGAMIVQYVLRLPVASNNQTIAFFMNIGIVTAISVASIADGSTEPLRERIYESLRIVARLLLATMYFYGIFHKINTDFLDPNASCAVALYVPLAHPFGLQDVLIGRYGAIASTFILEGVAIISLFWRRYFAVGLIVALWFHYIIPISAYSWYMDFSSLVFALYVLSVPREVSVAFYERTSALLRRAPMPSAGFTATLGLGVALAASFGLMIYLARLDGGISATEQMIWHSTWILLWAVIGGVAMVLLTFAALEALPYKPQALPRAPFWAYALPGVLFLLCLSPYVGLKTESSIAMFSNLHTEGGTTNHLLFQSPPYIADYQREVAMLTGSSSADLRRRADRGLGMVRYDLEGWMRRHPDQWVSFTMNGRHFERANAATFPIRDRSFLERKYLLFKPVDLARPKVCTH